MMQAAKYLEEMGDDLTRVIKNRDRIMRNRNNKKRELTDLRSKVARVYAICEDDPDDGLRERIVEVLSE